MAPFPLPLFPLPETVFFPHTLLPLHVFEPRYRAMVADCLAGEKRMVVVRLLPGWEQDYYGRPPIHTVAGAGEGPPPGKPPAGTDPPQGTSRSPGPGETFRARRNRRISRSSNFATAFTPWFFRGIRPPAIIPCPPAAPIRPTTFRMKAPA